MKRSALAYVPLAVWSAAVLVVGGLEGLEPPALPRHADKVAHFLMYGVGGVLAALVGRARGRGAGWLGLAFVVLVGAVDELRQAALATRDGDLMDWVADVWGAIVFYGVAALILRRR